MEQEFSGKVVIVTGSGSGIGAAIAQLLGQRGAAVVVADIIEDAARQTAQAIIGRGGTASPCLVDTSDPVSMSRAVDFSVSRFGKLDLAVNNAGVSGPLVSIVDLGVEDWRRVIDVNLSGVFYGMKYQIPAILEAGGGAIVNIASMFGVFARSNYPAYVAAKHGVVGLTKAAALDLAQSGVRINSVGPGVIDTPLLNKHVDADAQEVLRSFHPMGRFGTPAEVAELTAFLLSSRASFTTGAFYAVDGACTTGLA